MPDHFSEYGVELDWAKMPAVNAFGVGAGYEKHRFFRKDGLHTFDHPAVGWVIKDDNIPCLITITKEGDFDSQYKISLLVFGSQAVLCYLEKTQHNCWTSRRFPEPAESSWHKN